MTNLSDAALKSFTKEVFLKTGFPEEVAEIAANNLISADLKGIDSHGVARLSGYIRLVKAGRINTQAKPFIVHETPSTATLDADKGLGLWTAQKAMQIAIEKAENVGSGWVAVKNSSHFGIAANHALLAVEKNMIGLALTNASPLVAPAGSREAYLGTNPVCFAVPAGNYPPFVADLATSAAANGKLEIAQRKGKKIPAGWAQTKEGTRTENPDELKAGGTLLPLGSFTELGYHKGYALGSVVDIMSGVLSGANFGCWVPPFVAFLDVHKNEPGEGIGHFVGAWRIDAFQKADEFKAKMDQWIEGVKSLERSEGIDEVLIPGEPEHRMEKTRKKEGIPLTEKVVADLEKLASELDISFNNI